MIEWIKRQQIRSILLVPILILIACGPKFEDDASELDYELFAHTTGLIAQSHEKIDICVQGQIAPHLEPVMIDSVQKWLEPLRRQYQGITDEIKFACPGNVTVVLDSKIERAHAYPNSRPTIYISPNQNDFHNIFLHEMGHAFGLGDTYIEGVWSCKPGQPDSIMCRATRNYLQQDDINGVIAAYQKHFAIGSGSFGGAPGNPSYQDSNQGKPPEESQEDSNNSDQDRNQGSGRGVLNSGHGSDQNPGTGKPCRFIYFSIADGTVFVAKWKKKSFQCRNGQWIVKELNESEL